MGFFSGGGNSGYQQSESDRLVDEQFRQNQADIEHRRRNLQEERISIIKSQAGQQWHPNKQG